MVRRPVTNIADYEFTTDVKIDRNGASQSADITISVLGEGITASKSGYAVRAELTQFSYVPHPTKVLIAAAGFTSAKVFPSRATADNIVDSTSADLEISPVQYAALATIKATVDRPNLWTAETPNLYVLTLSLHKSIEDAEEGVYEQSVETTRVGFRSVSIKNEDNVLKINNVPIVIAGANRHEFNCRTGRAVSFQSMRDDAVMMKKWNFNAVRTAHYPNHPFFMEICDEVGLYVVDEANIESHGFQALGQPVGYFSSLPEWVSALSSRVTRMYERDKNFACVIGWSLGNESGYGKTHDLMANWLRKRDPSRFVQVCLRSRLL